MQQPPSSYREVRIGLTQAFAWLGFLGALVVLSFFLGLYIGKKSGFEAAKETSLEELARAPIDAPTGNDIPVPGDTNAQNANPSDLIYQKLQASPPTPQDTTTELPTLGKIAGVKDSPIELNVPQDKAAKSVMEAANAAAAIVGGSAGNDLNKKAESIAKAIVDGKEINVGGSEGQKVQFVAPTATPTPTATVTATATPAPSVVAAVPEVTSTTVVRPAEVATIAPTVAPTVEMILQPSAEPTKSTPKPSPTPKATATKAKPSPTPKPTVVKSEVTSIDSSVGKGWYAQVAAPQKMSDAQEIVNKLSGAGFKATIERAEVKGEQYYRVIVGPEKSKADADKTAGKLKSSGAVAGTPFVKQVK